MRISTEKNEDLCNEIDILIATYQRKCNVDKKIIISEILRILSSHICYLNTQDVLDSKDVLSGKEHESSSGSDFASPLTFDFSGRNYLVKFEKSEVTNKIKKIYKEADRFHKLERYGDFLRAQMEILSLIPAQFKLWNKYFKQSNSENFYIKIPNIELLLKLHVAMCDITGLKSIFKHVNEISSAYPAFDFEYFQVTYKKYLNDYDLYKRIYDYLRENKSGEQKDIYKKLYIADARVTKILTVSDKIGIIKRKKNGNKWMLYWNSDSPKNN